MPEAPDTVDPHQSDESEVLAGFEEHVQLDHELRLGLDADGTPGWRAARPGPPDGRTPQPIDHGRAPAAEDDDATPSPQPREDGPL